MIAAQPRTETEYTCSYFDDPSLAHDSTEDVLNLARDGGIASIQGVVISDRNLEIDGFPAKDAEVRARGNSLVDMRLIAVRGRIFGLMVVETDRNEPDSKNVRKFFNSFKLLK